MIIKTILLYITAIVSLVFLTDKNFPKATNTKSKKTIKLEILEPEESTIPSNLDVDLIVRITNSSLEDLYMPKILTPSHGNISMPTFYLLTTTPQEMCSAAFLHVRRRKRALETFIEIPGNSFREITYNPYLHQPSLWCNYKRGDKIKISISYEPEPQYFNDNYLKKGYELISDTTKLKEIYNKLPRDTVRSQELEFTLK